MRLLLPLVLITGAALAQEDDLAGLVGALNGHGPSRAAAREALLESQDKRTPELIESAVPRFTLPNQVVAIQLLRELPEAEGRPALRRLLEAEPPHLRLCAALALHDTGEPGLAKIMADVVDASALLSAMHIPLTRTLVAFGALEKGGAGAGLLGPERNEDFLVNFFITPEVRTAPDAIAIAQAIVEKDKRSGPRAAAAAYLLRHRKPDYAGALSKALAEPDFNSVHFIAVHVILSNRADEVHLPPSEIAAHAIAKAAARQQDGMTAGAMLLYLNRVKYPRLGALAERLIEHKSPKASMVAFSVLAGLKRRPPTDALKRILEHGDDGAALSAAHYLKADDDYSGFERVLLAARPNAPERERALRELGSYGRPEAVPLLLDAMGDPQLVVRMYAEKSLTATLGRLFPYRRFLISNTGYRIRALPEVREEALEKIRAWWDKNKEADW